MINRGIYVITMSQIDPEIESILEELSENPSEERLLEDILEWEFERVNNERRKNKLKKIGESIDEYVEEIE